MQKTLRNKGREVGGGGGHDFTLNVTVRYKGGGGGHFSPFFALRNISMAPNPGCPVHSSTLVRPINFVKFVYPVDMGAFNYYYVLKK